MSCDVRDNEKVGPSWLSLDESDDGLRMKCEGDIDDGENIGLSLVIDSSRPRYEDPSVLDTDAVLKIEFGACSLSRSSYAGSTSIASKSASGCSCCIVLGVGLLLFFCGCSSLLVVGLLCLACVAASFACSLILFNSLSTSLNSLSLVRNPSR